MKCCRSRRADNETSRVLRSSCSASCIVQRRGAGRVGGESGHAAVIINGPPGGFTEDHRLEQLH